MSLPAFTIIDCVQPTEEEPEKIKQKASFTKVFNEIMDKANRELKGIEFQLFYHVYRQTLGWYYYDNEKEIYRDEISNSQFRKATGRSRGAVVKGIKGLEASGWIHVGRQKGQTNKYAVGSKVYDTSDVKAACPIYEQLTFSTMPQNDNTKDSYVLDIEDPKQQQDHEVIYEEEIPKEVVVVSQDIPFSQSEDYTPDELLAINGMIKTVCELNQKRGIQQDQALITNRIIRLITDHRYGFDYVCNKAAYMYEHSEKVKIPLAYLTSACHENWAIARA